MKTPLKQNSCSKGWYSFPKRARCRCSVQISNNNLMVGAVGVLQFDVVVSRLKSESTEAVYE
ncbi:hypothetical protein ACNKHU_27455 [Shigella flexneri]